MKRLLVTICTLAAVFAALLNAARTQTVVAADDPMSLVIRAIDMWNPTSVHAGEVYYGGENDLLTWQDYHPADDLIAFGHVLHVSGRPDVTDSAGPRLLVASYRAAFPDLVLTAGAPVVDGNRATVTWTLRGTFQGQFAGLEPTGRVHEESGTVIFRIAGGQIVETWFQADTISALIRDGATPHAEPALCAQTDGTPAAPRFYEGGTPDPSKDDPYYTGA